MPAAFAGSDEEVGTIQIESPDYTDYELLNPGIYTSPSRVVTPEMRLDKNTNPFVMARVEFPELLTEEGTKVFLRKPLVRYIFSFTRKQKNRQGESSDIAQYLRAAGIEIAGLNTAERLQAALSESASLPVKVQVGWTNRTHKVNDEYTKEKAYTSDFKRGENGATTFVSKLTQDDISALPEKAQARLQEVLYNGSIQAKHRVDAFYKL